MWWLTPKLPTFISNSMLFQVIPLPFKITLGAECVVLSILFVIIWFGFKATNFDSILMPVHNPYYNRSPRSQAKNQNVSRTLYYLAIGFKGRSLLHFFLDFIWVIKPDQSLIGLLLREREPTN